ncbi:MAG: BrnT family toxin [Alphaproteobacteria bacterium]|nr:BrnT family toxin [Alphaproteobacteria bacterium]
MKPSYAWDETKRARNLATHGLDFVDAKLVFEAADKLTLESAREGETRFQDIAKIEGLVLSLAYAIQGAKVRVISFRRASRKERKAYDDGSKL